MDKTTETDDSRGFCISENMNGAHHRTANRNASPAESQNLNQECSFFKFFDNVSKEKKEKEDKEDE